MELQKKLKGDFVVFGSSPLYLLSVLKFNDINKFNDLDLAVKDESTIPPKAKITTFQKNPKQKLYKLKIKNIEVDIGSCWPGQEKYFYKIFQNPIIIDGFKFTNLDMIQKWKEIMVKKYNRQKDKYHLQKIKEYKQKTR